MGLSKPTLVLATHAELEAMVGLHTRSRSVCLPFLPVLHTRDEDLMFFGASIAAGTMLLARREGRLLGFMVVTPGWIEQLYLEPDCRGQGVGRALVERAKATHDALELWCFAENKSALAFYAAQGFVEVGGTDGDNESGCPDILLRWQKSI